VDVETLNTVTRELKKLNIGLLWRIKFFITAHIGLSIAFGVIVSILLGILTTLITNQVLGL
jgi:hypothetical protein